MRRTFEFATIAVLAAGLHFLAASVLDRSEVVAAAPTGGGGAGSIGNAGELAALIESWEDEPLRAEPTAQSEPEAIPDDLDDPDQMAAVFTPDAPDLTTPKTSDVAETVEIEQHMRPQSMASPDTLEILPDTSVEFADLPRPTSVSDPVVTPQAVDQIAPDPSLPGTADLQPRELESEPDPNQVGAAVAELAPSATAEALPIATRQVDRQPSRLTPTVPLRPTNSSSIPRPDPAPQLHIRPEIPVDQRQEQSAPDIADTAPDSRRSADGAVSQQIAALPIPETPPAPLPPPVELPPVSEPEDTGPAPLIAALPQAKPEIPAWAKQQPRQQANRRQKPTQRSTTRQRTQKPQRQAASNPSTRESPRQDAPSPQPSGARSNNTAAAPSAGGAGQGQQRAAIRPGNGAGQSGAGPSSGDRKAAQNKFVAAVRRAIMKKRRYPRKAERRGIAGRPVVRLTLGAGGQLLAASLVSSSGSDMLDNAAMKAVRAASYPSIPQNMGRSKITLKFGITFRPG